MKAEWKRFVKNAQEFSKDNKKFRLSPGKTLTHAVRLWNSSHPDQPISVKSLMEANGGLLPTRFQADRYYNMPDLKPVKILTPDEAYWGQHDTYVTAGGKSNKIQGLVNRRADVRKQLGPDIVDRTSAELPYKKRVENAITKAMPIIQKWENFRPEAYQDPLTDIWTIGYGHTYIKDPVTGKVRDVMPGDKINNKDSLMYLKEILQDHVEKLNRVNPWWKYLGENAMAASLDTSYNGGPYIFNKSHSPILDSQMQTYLNSLNNKTRQ